VRLETRGVLKQSFQNLIGWDSALGRTLSGSLIHDYVSGRRRRFVNPARFCLLSLTLWFLATRLFGIDPVDMAGINVTSNSGNNREIAAEIRDFIGSNLDLLMFLSLPLRALLMRTFFRGSGRNLAECGPLRRGRLVRDPLASRRHGPLAPAGHARVHSPGLAVLGLHHHVYPTTGDYEVALIDPVHQD
jgi:hypothetical protein